MSLTLPGDVQFNDRGLVTAVAQDWATGTVLMVAHMNQEALELTVSTGEAHFWSRSRQQLWRKGETSGNLLRVERLQLDCDGDAVLLSVRPQGPACHLGRRACFGEPGILTDALQATLESRQLSPTPDSYSSKLLRAGIPAICRKVGEEATEVILAAHEDGPGELVAEIADLWFHTLVLLVATGHKLDDVLVELAARHERPRPAGET